MSYRKEKIAHNKLHAPARYHIYLHKLMEYYSEYLLKSFYKYAEESSNEGQVINVWTRK